MHELPIGYSQKLCKLARTIILRMTSNLGPARVALVTGGNGGIGFAISKQFAEAGIKVIIGSRDISRGEAAARSIVNANNYTQILPLCEQHLDSG